MVVYCSVGFSGMDTVIAMGVPDDATQEYIDDEAWMLAVDNADSFGYYPMPDEYDDGEDEDATYSEEGSDHYVDSIEGYAEDYDPEKHDGLRPGGGSFEDDF